MGTETANRLGLNRPLHQQVERSWPLGAPGDAVEIVTLDVIFDDAQVPGAVVRIVEAEALRRPTPGIDFEALWEVWVVTQRLSVAALFYPGDTLHAPTF